MTAKSVVWRELALPIRKSIHKLS